MDLAQIARWFQSPANARMWATLDACLWIALVLLQLLQSIPKIGPKISLLILVAFFGLGRAILQAIREVQCSGWTSQFSSRNIYFVLRILVSVVPSVASLIIAAVRHSTKPNPHPIPLILAIFLLLESNTKLVFDCILKRFNVMSEGERAFRAAIEAALQNDDAHLRSAIEEALRPAVEAATTRDIEEGALSTIGPIIESAVRSMIRSVLKLSRDLVSTAAEAAIAVQDARAERAGRAERAAQERIARAELDALSDMVERVEKDAQAALDANAALAARFEKAEGERAERARRAERAAQERISRAELDALNDRVVHAEKDAHSALVANAVLSDMVATRFEKADRERAIHAEMAALKRAARAKRASAVESAAHSEKANRERAIRAAMAALKRAARAKCASDVESAAHFEKADRERVRAEIRAARAKRGSSVPPEVGSAAHSEKAVLPGKADRERFERAKRAEMAALKRAARAKP